MEQIIDYFDGPTLTVPIIMARLIYGTILGGLVGIEREKKHQPAGVRTHMLICLGATMLMLLSIYLPQQYPGTLGTGDPGRIAAQVVSGIGFLGAGAIVRMGMDVRGLTTAASIWVIAALGLLAGAGMYLTAFVSMLLMLFSLQFLDGLTRKWFPRALPRRMVIVGDGLQVRMMAIRQITQGFGVEVRGVSLEYQVKKEGSSVTLDVRIPESVYPEELIAQLSALDGIKKVSIDFTS